MAGNDADLASVALVLGVPRRPFRRQNCRSQHFALCLQESMTITPHYRVNSAIVGGHAWLEEDALDGVFAAHRRREGAGDDASPLRVLPERLVPLGVVFIVQNGAEAESS